MTIFGLPQRINWRLFELMNLNLRRSLVMLTLAGLLTTQCAKEEPDKRLILALFLLTGDAATNYGGLYARIFQFKSDITTSATIANMQIPGTPDSAKKKLILVHGWKPGDSESAGRPTDDQLMERIVNTYSTFLTASAGDRGAAHYFANNYDLYGFTYLTADGIDTNGSRFRARLDDLFGSVNDNTVHVLAHSMGGLITRFAMYEGSSPAYLRRLVALGTPWHGSPWASTTFQKDFSSVGTALGGQLTGTAGGRDLAWDNYNNMTGNYSNLKLTNINNKSDDRDCRIYRAYGSINNNSGNAISTGFTSVCRLLDGEGFGPTNASDCVVPQDSASFANNTRVKNLNGTSSYATQDHKAINLENNTDSLRTNVFDTMELGVPTC